MVCLPTFELPAIDLTIGREKPTCFRHVSSRRIRVRPRVAVSVFLRGDDFQCFDCFVVLALFSGLFDDVEHGTIRIRETGAFRFRKSIFENPFIHNSVMLRRFGFLVKYRCQLFPLSHRALNHSHIGRW